MVDCVAELSIEVIGRPLRTPREDLLRAVDPEHFVNIRAIPDGPAPKAALAAIEYAETEATKDKRGLREKSGRLQEYPARIRNLCHALVDRAKAAEQV